MGETQTPYYILIRRLLPAILEKRQVFRCHRPPPMIDSSRVSTNLEAPMATPTYWADKYIENRRSAVPRPSSGSSRASGSSSAPHVESPSIWCGSSRNAFGQLKDIEVVRLFNLETTPLTLIAEQERGPRARTSARFTPAPPGPTPSPATSVSSPRSTCRRCRGSSRAGCCRSTWP